MTHPRGLLIPFPEGGELRGQSIPIINIKKQK